MPHRIPGPRARAFVVHHNPSSGKYNDYGADPTDALASARALVDTGEHGWVAGNCHRLIERGDLLLFKFGGPRLQQEPGIYAAARVTRSPFLKSGVWRFKFRADATATAHLCAHPMTGRKLDRIVGRSFGASIQQVPAERLASLDELITARARGSDAEPQADSRVTHGLVVMKKPLDQILSGRKTWEIRGKATTRRGPIALSEKGTGHIVGTCDIVDVVGPVSLAQLRRKSAGWGAPASSLAYGEHTYGLVLENARRLAEPVPYEHPVGAVVWVKLARATAKRVDAQRRAAAHRQR